jgi:hypothetical protein
MKPHQVSLAMPQPILDYFQKDRSDLPPGTMIEYRTELVVEKLRYRAHPNYQDSGPCGTTGSMSPTRLIGKDPPIWFRTQTFL